MPRGGRSRGRSMSPVRRSPAPRTTAVAPTRQTAPMMQQPASVGQPRQPGLMGQMAATAGGVAIGSTVGHVIGSAITGGGRSDHPDVTYQESPPQGGQQQQQQQNPCQYQMEQFIHCTQDQSDISLCQGFNDAFKQCKLQYGLQ